jgi:micrococcal nuclease
MNNVTRFPRGRRARSRGPKGPWDFDRKAKASPLWIKAALAFAGAVAVTQLGIWRYQDYLAAEAAPPVSADSQRSSDTERDTESDTESASFGFCHEGGGTNCVVDGDTIYYQGTKIRIADIDTPETHEPRCGAEAALGAKATQRLHALVNAGPFSLESIDRDEDVYGRKLRILLRNGESLGETLVDEGLARWYEGGRRPWC